jgi:hypothetical protein
MHKCEQRCLRKLLLNGLLLFAVNPTGGIKKMKKAGSLLSILLVCFTFIFVSQAMAADKNVKTMAEIMLKLNHYPSDSEKETLRQISLSSTATDAEKTMANAMIHLEHTATAEDKKKLSKIVKDDSVSEDERTLAKIIRDVQHKPSAEDKEKLKKLE